MIWLGSSLACAISAAIAAYVYQYRLAYRSEWGWCWVLSLLLVIGALFTLLMGGAISGKLVLHALV